MRFQYCIFFFFPICSGMSNGACKLHILYYIDSTLTTYHSIGGRIESFHSIMMQKIFAFYTSCTRMSISIHWVKSEDGRHIVVNSKHRFNMMGGAGMCSVQVLSARFMCGCIYTKNQQLIIIMIKAIYTKMHVSYNWNTVNAMEPKQKKKRRKKRKMAKIKSYHDLWYTHESAPNAMTEMNNINQFTTNGQRYLSEYQCPILT